MKIPDEIWLQTHDDDGEPLDYETTWCAEKINGTDVKYIRDDLVFQRIKDFQQMLKNNDSRENINKQFLAFWKHNAI